MKEIRALTGIRFAAAAWVVAFHLRVEITSWCPSLGPLNSLINQGHLAVPFFFILSGFILSHVYFPTYSLGQHGQFVWRRFARLWPVHVAMIVSLLAYVAISAGVHDHYVSAATYPLAALPLDLLMVRGWFSAELFWNFPAWTIHCEWFAYIVLFPVCFLLFRPIRRPLYLLLILCALLTAHVYLADAVPGTIGQIAFLFMAGSVLYCLRMLWPGARGSLICLGGVALFVLGCYTEQGSAFYLAFACLVLGLSYEQGWISWLFSTRLFVFGGTISYSLYMSHEVVHKYGGEVIKLLGLNGDVHGYAILLGLIGVMLVAAVIVHKLIEVPANRWLRNFPTTQLSPSGRISGERSVQAEGVGQ